MKENALLSIVFMIYKEDKYYDLNEVTFICVGWWSQPSKEFILYGLYLNNMNSIDLRGKSF